MKVQRIETVLLAVAWLLGGLAPGCGFGGSSGDPVVIGGTTAPANPNGPAAGGSGEVQVSLALDAVPSPRHRSVTLGYTLSSSVATAVSVMVEYRVGSGQFAVASEKVADPATEGTSGLAASPEGARHRFVWDAQADRRDANSPQVTLRLSVLGASNPSLPGPVTKPAAVSNAFVLNNGPPVVASVSPASGTEGVALYLSILGSGFLGATGATLDDAAKSPLTQFVVISDTTLTATLPANVPAGTYQLLVSTPGGTNTASGNTVVISRGAGAPVVSTVSPSSATNDAQTAVTVTGVGFTGATGAALAGAAATSLTSLVVLNDTTLTAAVPAGIAPGGYDVQVTTPAGKNLTSAQQFTVQAAVIPAGVAVVTTVVPTSAPANASTPLTVSGSNFTGATALDLVGTATVSLAPFSVVNDSTITATLPAGTAAGSYVPRVTTPAGSSALAGAPTITVTPATGGSAGGSTDWDEPARDPSSANPYPWLSRSALATAASEVVVEDYQNTVYAFGGDVGGAISPAVRRYDPSGDVWSTTGTLATARAGACAARIGSVIYVIGGHDGSSALATVETFNAATSAVGSAAAMGVARNHAVAVVEGGKVFVFGGASQATQSISGALASAETYDPAADKWTPIADLPGPRWAAMGASVGGKVFLIGGHDGGNTGLSALNSLLEYDPAKNTYQSKAPAFARRHAGVAMPYGGRLFVIGGTYTLPGWVYGDISGDVQFDTSLVEVYDPVADSWATRQTMLTARTMLGGSMADGFGYLVGGHSLDLTGGLASSGSGDQASKANGPVPLGPRHPTAVVERFDPLTLTGTTAPAGSGGSGGTTTQGHYNVSIPSSGSSRVYRLYVPANYTNATPRRVVLMLHGTTHDVTVGELDVARFEAQADRDTVLLVMPQGALTVGPSNPPIYAPGYPNPIFSVSPFGLTPVPGETHVPNYPDVYSGAGVPASTWEMHDWQPTVNLDYQFMLDVLADLSARYNVDTKRVYQFGQSGGALHTSTVATHHGEVYAACVSIAGGDIVSAYSGSSMSFGGLSGWPAGTGPQGPTPSVVAQAGTRRTPFLFIHGAADVDVPVAGTTSLRAAMRNNGWDENDTQAHLCPGGGHIWFTLNEEIWAFFMSRSLP
ncbi:MAG: IPT/TIG domain-containing protein [Planctomycetes bacterium]|nr:IPT/TIG domain-containing protein [Planctomycetota bacterium]